MVGVEQRVEPCRGRRRHGLQVHWLRRSEVAEGGGGAQDNAT